MNREILEYILLLSTVKIAGNDVLEKPLLVGVEAFKLAVVDTCRLHVLATYNYCSKVVDAKFYCIFTI
jgi:hypothetical protein